MNTATVLLRDLVAWIEATGVERMPAFAGANVQPLQAARLYLATACPAGGELEPSMVEAS